MQTPSPWIIGLSIYIYRCLLRLGPVEYRREYGELTLQLFRECCRDAYEQRGFLGVISLWPSMFTEAIVGMLTEHFSALQHPSSHRASTRNVVSLVPSERTSPMNISIQVMSALTRFRRRSTGPLLYELIRASRLMRPVNLRFEQKLCHWQLLEDARLSHYERGIDPDGPQSEPGAYLVSAVAGSQEFALLRQAIEAENYQGKHIRISGDIRSEHVEQQGGLYVCVVDPRTRGDRPQQAKTTQGTHDWVRYEISMMVPEDALYILFGLILYGRGQIWLANVRFEVVEQNIAIPA